MKVNTYWWIEDVKNPRTIFFAEYDDPLEAKEFISDGIADGYKVFTLEIEDEDRLMLNSRLWAGDCVKLGGFSTFPHNDPWSQKVIAEGICVSL